MLDSQSQSKLLGEDLELPSRWKYFQIITTRFLVGKRGLFHCEVADGRLDVSTSRRKKKSKRSRSSDEHTPSALTGLRNPTVDRPPYWHCDESRPPLNQESVSLAPHGPPSVPTLQTVQLNL